MEESTKPGRGTLIAILASYIMFMALGAFSPALQSYMEAFPEVSRTNILMLSSLPSLFVVPASIISGNIAGKKIGFKPLLLASLAVTTIAGTAPVFLKSFPAILVSRAILGISLGAMFPLCSALVVATYEGQERANVLGAGQLTQNVASVIMKLAAGALCAIAFNLTALVYLVAAVAFVLVLIFLREPELSTADDAARDQGPSKRGPLEPGVIFWAVIWGFMSVFTFPLMLNVSSVIAVEGMGGAGEAGIATALFTGGGMFGGAVFGFLYKHFKGKTAAITTFVVAAGMAIAYLSGGLTSLCAGVTVAGLGNAAVWATIYMELGNVTDKDGFSRASGLMMALMNVVSFLSAYFVTFVTSFSATGSPKFVILVCAIGQAAIAVFLAARSQKAAGSAEEA